MTQARQNELDAVDPGWCPAWDVAPLVPQRQRGRAPDYGYGPCLRQDGRMTEIRTPRLLLRTWHDDDLPPMADINADPRVMRWIDDGSVRDLDHTAEDIERWEEEWDEEGFGLFAVELLASGELIGFTGLSVPEFLPEVMPAVAISWRIGSQFWGQGYASEAAHATLEFALQDRGLDRVISINRVGDNASENVIRKLGMAPERETAHPVYGYPLRVHAIDLTEFQA